MRGISSRMEGSAARTVAPRGRPEIRPTSPTIEPRGIGTVIRFLPAPTSTSTEPEAMPNSDEPIELRLKMTSPELKARTSESSRNSRI